MYFRTFLLSALVAVLGFAAGCGASRQQAYVQTPKAAATPAAAATDAMTQAHAAWDGREDTAKLKEALAVYEKIVAKKASRDVFTRLSRGYYLLATGHLKKEEEILAAYDKGASYGERILGLRAEFIKCIKEDKKDYECLGVCKKGDVPGIYWAYANLGKWSVLKGFTTVLKNKSKLKNFVDTAAKLDPAFYHGAADRGLGAYYAKAPSFAGGDLDKSKTHFDKSLALAPNYLGTKVLMAEYWTVKKQDRKLFEKLLKEVIAADANIVPDIAPIQKIEQRKAKALLKQAEDLFE